MGTELLDKLHKESNLRIGDYIVSAIHFSGEKKSGLPGSGTEVLELSDGLGLLRLEPAFVGYKGIQNGSLVLDYGVHPSNDERERDIRGSFVQSEHQDRVHVPNAEQTLDLVLGLPLIIEPYEEEEDYQYSRCFVRINVQEVDPSNPILKVTYTAVPQHIAAVRNDLKSHSVR